MKTVSIAVSDETLDLAKELVEAEKYETQADALAYILKVGTGRARALQGYAKKTRRYEAAIKADKVPPMFKPYAALHVPKVEAQREALKEKAARVLRGMAPPAKKPAAKRASAGGGEVRQ